MFLNFSSSVCVCVVCVCQVCTAWLPRGDAAVPYNAIICTVGMLLGFVRVSHYFLFENFVVVIACDVGS